MVGVARHVTTLSLRNTHYRSYVNSNSSSQSTNSKQIKRMTFSHPFYLVGVARLELTASCPPDKRATNCAIPRLRNILYHNFFYFATKKGVNIRLILKKMLQYFCFNKLWRFFMRIRRKKHLEERLSSVNDLVLVADRDIANVVEAIKDKKYYDFKKLFSNDNPVELEIGCGKGGFIVKKAGLNKDVNFIAVELLSNIIVMAAELARKNQLSNVKFVNSSAEYLPRYIKDESINNIYLNFSPPFPPNSYESHRLTCDRRVKEYKNYLVKGGSVFQKTDDKEFFDYSFEKFVENGFIVEDVSSKINNGEMDNVITEYEQKFRNLNMPIYALIAKK